jgi:hypothetical protein
MKKLKDRLVCPQHDKCDSPACGGIIGNLPAVAFQNTDTGEKWLYHVMCAPPRIRKAYHEGQAHG